MQSVSVIAALLLTLGCMNMSFADEVPAPYGQDMTSSDSVEMDGLTQLTQIEPEYGNNTDEYRSDDNENNESNDDDTD